MIKHIRLSLGFAAAALAVGALACSDASINGLGDATKPTVRLA